MISEIKPVLKSTEKTNVMPVGDGTYRVSPRCQRLGTRFLPEQVDPGDGVIKTPVVGNEVTNVGNEVTKEATTPKGQTKTRGIRIPDDEWAAVQETAKRRGETVTSEVRRTLRQYVKRNSQQR